MDADVAQIVNITSATPERAAQYLQLADGDLDAAVMLYFESNGADPSGGSLTDSGPPPPPAVSRSNAGGNPRNPIDIEDDNTSENDDLEMWRTQKVSRSGSPAKAQTQGATFDSDAEYARKLQEEMYGEQGGPAASGEEEIRAPIARQSETLLGPGAEMGPLDDQDIPAQVMQQMQSMQNRRTQQARAGIFNQRPTTSAIWNERDDGDAESGLLAESTGGASQASSRSNMLAKMYQPPWDLMYRRGWENARQEGREQEKWLLVNIQDGSVFDCQVLNRDLWKNPSVVETVRENFIFLQHSKDDSRAEQYLQYYFQEHSNSDLYPHIAIVDPRTGEQVKVWSAEVPKSGDFLMQLHEFLDRYSLSSHARNPVAKRKPETKKPKTVDQMTEEEQLERAMQASLAGRAESTEKLRVEDPDDLTRSVGDADRNTSIQRERNSDSSSAAVENGHETTTTTTTRSTNTTSSPSSSETSRFHQIPSNHHHIEPALGSTDVTRIQFRHPGGRIIRRFSIHDPVQRIFEWLKAEQAFSNDKDKGKEKAKDEQEQEHEDEYEQSKEKEKDKAIAKEETTISTTSTSNSTSTSTAKNGTGAFEFELVSMGKNLIEVVDQSIDEAGLKNGTVMIELLHA